MQRELQAVKKKYAALLRAERKTFPDARQRIDAPIAHGVYVIYSPRGAVLHVGRTVTGKRGLRQRLNNHLQGQSSFTAAMFKRQGHLLRGSYCYSLVEEPNDRRRALLEAYAVGHLCPRHLGTGKNAS